MNKLLKNLVFIDIETVCLTKHYSMLHPRLQEAWNKKALTINPNCTDPDSYFFEKGAIYAEFGKIVVIGLGYFHKNEDKELCLRTKAIASDNEKELLIEFCEVLEKGFKGDDIILCAHNGKEFDFPYLCRRMLVNGLKLPKCLDIAGKKPWEVKHHDTLEMWKFGDRKSFTSLELLAAVFDIPTSKEGIDGSKVSSAYHLNEDLESIANYCKRDVEVLAQIFLKMNGIELPKTENMVLL
ncbi:MAG: 3'-5' exonuclease [Opitutaceae bacterium]|nr:3'-5' exonuclease [Cytophagales bacterium]